MATFFAKKIKYFLFIILLTALKAFLAFSQDNSKPPTTSQTTPTTNFQATNIASESLEDKTVAKPSEQSTLQSTLDSDTSNLSTTQTPLSFNPFSTFKLQSLFLFNTALYSNDAAKNTYNAGFLEKVNFRDLTAVYSYKVPSTKYSEGFDTENAAAIKFSNFGAQFRLEKILGIPLTFSLGRLTPSAAFQKFTSPYLSTSISNFGYTLPLPNVVEARLPR